MASRTRVPGAYDRRRVRRVLLSGVDKPAEHPVYPVHDVGTASSPQVFSARPGKAPLGAISTRAPSADPLLVVAVAVVDELVREEGLEEIGRASCRERV